MNTENKHWTTQKRQNKKERIHTYSHRLKSIIDKPAPAGGIFNIKTLYALRPKFSWQTKTKKKLHACYEIYIVCSKHLYEESIYHKI